MANWRQSRSLQPLICDMGLAGQRVRIIKGMHRGAIGHLVGCTDDNVYFIQRDGLTAEAAHALAYEGPFLPSEFEFV